MDAFAQCWSRIREHAGETFTTKRGLPFTYALEGDGIRPSRAEQVIARSDFAKAFSHVPYARPSLLNDAVRGPSYVWAILHDSRIRREAGSTDSS